MALVALIKFSQGLSTPPGGQALAIAAGGPDQVVVGIDNNDSVASWRIELLYGPPGSGFERDPGDPLVWAQNPGDATPSYSFTSATGVDGECYRIRLRVWDGPNYTGTMDEDIRCVGVPRGALNAIFPPNQIDPAPLTSKPNELNFGGQLFHWSGDTPGDSGGVRLINPLLAALVDAAGGAAWTGEQVYYFGKHGNDSDDGLRPDTAVLTIGQALALAVAQTPSSSNRFTLVCTDAGLYTESVTIPGWVSLHAPDAKIEGLTIVAPGSGAVASAHAHEFYGNSTAAVRITGPGEAHVQARRITDSGGAGIGVQVTGADVIAQVDCDYAASSGYGSNFSLSCTGASVVTVFCRDLRSLSGSGCIADGAGAGCYSHFVLGTLRSVAGNGISHTTASDLSVVVGRFDASSRWNCTAGTTRLFIGDLAAGSELGTTGLAYTLGSHGSDTANPHATDLGNLGSGTLAELNALVTDATLDANTGSRPPNGAAGGDLAATYPNPEVVAIQSNGVGSTRLAIASVDDLEFLQRNGNSIFGTNNFINAGSTGYDGEESDPGGSSPGSMDVRFTLGNIRTVSISSTGVTLNLVTGSVGRIGMHQIRIAPTAAANSPAWSAAVGTITWMNGTPVTNSGQWTLIRLYFTGSAWMGWWYQSGATPHQLDGATPTVSLTTTGQPGASDNVARQDHRHEVSALGTAPVNVGGSGATPGSSSSVSRHDHKHAITLSAAEFWPLSIPEVADPGTPASGFFYLWADSTTNRVHLRRDDGVTFDLTS